MTDPRFWIWLQGALGLGNHKVGEVLRQFGSPEPLYRMGDRELTETGIFTPKEAASLRLSSLESAQRQVELARRYGCVGLASGAADLVTDGARTTARYNGTPQLGQVTGTGCMLGALCACFLAAAEPMAAAEAACVTLGAAGERAATPKGSGTFLVNLMDQLSTLDGDTIQACERTEELHREETT